MVAELRGGRAWPSESGHLATSAPSPSSLYSETPPLLYTGDGGHRALLRIFVSHINISNSRDRRTVSEWLLVPRYTTHSSLCR